MDAYERLLGDAMDGDATLFAREDGVEAAWRIVDPDPRGRTPVHEYEPGTWGPRKRTGWRPRSTAGTTQPEPGVTWNRRLTSPSGGGSTETRPARQPTGSRWGPYLSERAVGHRARGLQRERRRLGLLPARPRAVARLPLERGRPAAASATATSGICFALALWNGQDPILKERLFGLTNSRGQSRRGRQGVLLLPRRHAHALVLEDALQVPSVRVPLRAARRGKPPARPARPRAGAGRSRVCSTAAATSTCSSSTPRPRPTTSSLPDYDSRTAAQKWRAWRVLPQAWFRNTWSLGRARRGRASPRRGRPAASMLERARATGAGTCSVVRRTPELLFTENDTNTDGSFGTVPTRRRT